MLPSTLTLLVTVSLASAASLHGGSGLLDHSPDRLTSTHCGGRRRTCLDPSTLLHCLPVSFKVVPAFVESCSYDTPLCVENKCVKAPRYRHKRDTPCVDNDCVEVAERETSPCVGDACVKVPKRDKSPYVDNKSVKALRHKRDTQPELDLSGVQCNGKTSVCLNCTMTVHCIQTGKKFYPVIPTGCPFDTPYCIDGKCGTKDPGRCQVQPPPKSYFKCAEGVEGYLPDPESCSVYHFCAKKTSYDYKCISDTLSYDQQKSMCTTKNDTCFQMNCTRPLEYVVYPPDPSVYALCKGAGAAGAILARCPENHTFDISAEQCVRTCVTEGRQPDPDSVYAYFECSRGGDSWTVIPAVCPAGAKFDGATQKCVLD